MSFREIQLGISLDFDVMFAPFANPSMLQHRNMKITTGGKKSKALW